MSRSHELPLKGTSLYSCHLQAGARMVSFAGFEMPLQYRGVLEEHRSVRTQAGLFDVSHMGELLVFGPGAATFLQWLTPNDVSLLDPGRAQYSALLSERGTFLDDLLVYRLDRSRFLLVVNAAYAERDLAWVRARAAERGEAVEIEDRSEATGLLALQGPRAQAILERKTAVDLSALRYYRFVEGQVGGLDTLVSRTGYTGEDGFELYLRSEEAPELWRLLLEAGQDQGLAPVGLGARDTLRLEAGLMLSGQDIEESITPLEAGLQWMVKLAKGDFIGRQALLAQQAAGVRTRIVGFEMSERGIARPGQAVMVGSEQRGLVTSGTWSPTLQRAIGLARLDAELAEPGQELHIDVRGRELRAHTVALPFYRRPISN